MKRSFAILMIAIYAVLSIGVRLQPHSCCDHFSDSSFFCGEVCEAASNSSKTCCGNESNCCSFQELNLKIVDSHCGSDFKLCLSSFVLLSRNSHYGIAANDIDVSFDTIHSSGDPPQDIPLYIQLRSLVFYA